MGRPSKKKTTSKSQSKTLTPRQLEKSAQSLIRTSTSGESVRESIPTRVLRKRKSITSPLSNAVKVTKRRDVARMAEDVPAQKVNAKHNYSSRGRKRSPSSMQIKRAMSESRENDVSVNDFTSKTTPVATRSTGRKRPLEVFDYLDPNTNHYVDIDSLSPIENISKRPRISLDADAVSSLGIKRSRSQMSMSPTVVLSPLKSPRPTRRKLAPPGDVPAACSESARESSLSFHDNDESPTPPLPETASTSGKGSMQLDCNLSSLQACPSDSLLTSPASRPEEKLSPQLNGEPSEAEAALPMPNVNPSARTHTPKPYKVFTKREADANKRRTLLQRLDHYDLSDRIAVSDVFPGWPEVDIKPGAAEVSLLEALKPTRRIWFSPAGLPTTGDKDLIGLKATRLQEEAGLMEQHHHHPYHHEETERGSIFCFASIILPLPAADGVFESQTEGHAAFLEDVTDIRPDILWLQNIHPTYASTTLLPALMKRGYSASPDIDECPRTPLGHLSFMLYRTEVFSHFLSRRVHVQSMARRLVRSCAYRQSWKERLLEAFTELSSCVDPEEAQGPELLIACLRDRASGCLLLVGCLSNSSSNKAVFTEPLPPSPKDDLQACDYLFSIPLGGTITTTVTMSNAGSFAAPTDEWVPPLFNSRPDLAAVNAAGCLWALESVWEEVLDLQSHCKEAGESEEPNGSASGARPSSQMNGLPEGVPTAASSQEFRWVLCLNLEASPTSPIYQILRDGYPSDESLLRLRTVRNVFLDDGKSPNPSALIDLLWHAFQHPCQDVVSSYHSVLGREPPFTRFKVDRALTESRMAKCVDYIFCSGSTLQTRGVFMPACRGILPALKATLKSQSTLSEMVIPLAARISLRA